MYTCILAHTHPHAQYTYTIHTYMSCLSMVHTIFKIGIKKVFMGYA